MLGKQANTTVLEATVIGVDSAKKLCVVEGAMEGAPVSLPYDYLVLATGVQHSYFGHDEYAPFAPGLKTIADADHLRNKILGAFEDCERTLRRGKPDSASVMSSTTSCCGIQWVDSYPAKQIGILDKVGFQALSPVS